MKALSLRSNFSWTLAGQIVYAGTQWGIITLLARQGTSAMVGEYALALAIASPVIIFLNLKLRAVQASDARDEYAFADYFGLRLVTSFLALLVIVGIALFGDQRGDVQRTIIILAVAKSFESISDILFGLQQKHERMDLVSRSMIIKGLLSLAGFALGFALSDRVSGGAFGVAAAWMLTLLFIDIPSARRTLRETAMSQGEGSREHVDIRHLRPRFDRRVMWSLVVLTIPLGITVMLGSLSSNIPRYFIDHFLGASDLGVYAAMIYPLVASSMIISALAQSATPRLSTTFQNKNFTAFRSLLLKLVGIGAGIGIGGVLVVAIAGRQIISLLYGEAYVEHQNIFLWVMVNAAIGYLYLFLGTALNAMRRFHVQLPIHVVSVTTLTVLCWLFIDKWGLNGALTALTLTALLEAAMYLFIVLTGIRAATSLPTTVDSGELRSSMTEQGINRKSV